MGYFILNVQNIKINLKKQAKISYDYKDSSKREETEKYSYYTGEWILAILGLTKNYKSFVNKICQYNEW